MPAFKHNGVLVWFAAFSNHCSLFPTASVIEAFKSELKGFSISKGTIQFPRTNRFDCTYQETRQGPGRAEQKQEAAPDRSPSKSYS